MRALAWMARRVVGAVLVIVGAAVIATAIAVALPGDPARVLVGPQARAADDEAARRIHGLDGSATERLGRHLRRIVHVARGGAPPAEHASCASPVAGLHVDLGHSFVHRQPVANLLWARLPRSLELAAAALLVQLVVGVGAGLLAGSRRGGRVDDAAMGAALLGAAAPTFVVGAALQHALAYRLRLLPFDGVGRTPGEHLASLVLPALVLGLYGSALLARVTRDELRGALAATAALTARAKGASRLRIVLVHGLRNALVPIATLALLDLGALAGGAIVTERVFRWPGLGDLAVTAVLNRDASLIAGVTMVAAVGVVVASLAIDVLTLALDPRVRSG